MPGQGVDAHREQAEAAAKNRGGGNRAPYVLIMEGGERIMARFRGFTRRLQPAFVTEPGGRNMTADAIADVISTLHKAGSISDNEIVGLCLKFAVYTKAEKDGKVVANVAPIEDLIRRLAWRYRQLEPFSLAEHQVYGKSVPMDQSRWACAKDWNAGVPKEAGKPDPQWCAACWAMAAGDKRLSLKAPAMYSVVPDRWYHSEKGKKGSFEYCGQRMLNKQPCRRCAAGHEAKPEGLKMFPLASMFATPLNTVADQMGSRCASKCRGMGTIEVIGYQCEHFMCGEPFDTLHPGDVVPKMLRCPACRHDGPPMEIVRCSEGCQNARRAQLFDADIEVTRTGVDKQTNYTFTVMPPFTLAPDRVLRQRLPDYWSVLAPVGVDEECRRLGIPNNPFTGDPVGRAAPPPQGESSSYSDEPAPTDVPY